MAMSIFIIILILLFIALVFGGFLLFSELILRLGRNLMEKSHVLEGEIVERQKAQVQAEKSLGEKELLLREIHHRVKNNMQIVSSLLRLQAKRQEDQTTKDILDDSRSRISAMSLIHESLYRPENLTGVYLRRYIQELALNLFASYDIEPGRIVFITDVEPISLNIETATPCGLIINELVTNSLKYAFPDGRQGEVGISLKRLGNGEKYQLRVADNGVGLPVGLDIRRTKSLGLQLVVNLAENQLSGEVTVEAGPGTAFVVTFQEIGYEKRI